MLCLSFWACFVSQLDSAGDIAISVCRPAGETTESSQGIIAQLGLAALANFAEVLIGCVPSGKGPSQPSCHFVPLQPLPWEYRGSVHVQMLRRYQLAFCLPSSAVWMMLRL